MHDFLYNSPLGQIRFAVIENKLVAMHFSSDTADIRGHEPNESEQTIVNWLDAYFAGKKPDPRSLTLLLQGTPFQKRVWEKLLAIPYGKTVTYGAIAAEIDSGARAVGGAVGRNPVCIIAPCHRVIRTSGELGGYGEGIDRKLWLLRHEGCPGF